MLNVKAINQAKNLGVWGLMAGDARTWWLMQENYGKFKDNLG